MKDLDLKDFDQQIASYKAGFQPDLTAAQDRLHARLGAVPVRSAAVRRLGKPAWLGVAATVLLLLVAGYFLFSAGKTTLYNDTDAPLAVTLPDGTEVLLQQGAELSYDKAYNEEERLVTLVGQAFFEVHKDKQRPFLARAAGTVLRVTGTAFNLRIEGEELEVEVSEGSVDLHREGKVMAVGAKQCGRSVPGKQWELMEAENLNLHAWRTGKLTFQGTPLATVLETIGKNYGLKITYTPDCDFPISGAFAADGPLAVLRSIAELGGGNLVESHDGSWVLEGCD